MKVRTTCPKCQESILKEVPEDSKEVKIECPKCGHLFIAKPPPIEEYGWEEHGEPRKTILSSFKKKTSRPTIASFLLLTVSILGIFTVAALLSDNLAFFPQLGDFISYLTRLCPFLTILLLVFSVFALAGFVTAFKRRYFIFTAVCAFIGIFSIGFFVGFILSIVALLLIIMCRDEFEDGTKGKVF
jgi:DNA-directed RNA polymerase subunit RPC12/RpoP